MMTIGPPRRVIAVVACLLPVLLLSLGTLYYVFCPAVGVSCSTSLSSDKKTLEFRFSNGVTMKLVRIEAGEFTMGSPESEAGRWDSEGPQRQVTIIKPFYMGVTEVTQAQWQGVMNTQPWEDEDFTRGGADTPASYITWDNATLFCALLSNSTGRTVRLPTEAEWEYACRAGTTTAYSFGDDLSKLGDYAWCSHNANGPFPCPVGVKKPNAWGLYDMHGNVLEWCSDWFAYTYADTDTRDPKGPATGDARVLRSGAIFCPRGCRAAFRHRNSPVYPYKGNGLRVVVECGPDVQ